MSHTALVCAFFGRPTSFSSVRPHQSRRTAIVCASYICWYVSVSTISFVRASVSSSRMSGQLPCFTILHKHTHTCNSGLQVPIHTQNTHLQRCLRVASVQLSIIIGGITSEQCVFYLLHSMSTCANKINITIYRETRVRMTAWSA